MKYFLFTKHLFHNLGKSNLIKVNQTFAVFYACRKSYFTTNHSVGSYPNGPLHSAQNVRKILGSKSYDSFFFSSGLIVFKICSILPLAIMTIIAISLNYIFF